jgi:RNA polymerase sigma-70 factor (ECF subfamily)
VALAVTSAGLTWDKVSREAAFERLMALHERLVLRTAWRLLGRLEDAQDAAQEVFLRLYRHLGDVDESAVEAWLYRTTVNVCYDALRRRRPEGELVLEPSVAAEGSASLEAAAKRRLLAEGIKHLPPQERAAVTLCSIEGLSTSQAAEILGLAEGTVRSHLSLARTRLKEYVGRFWQ